MNYFNEGIKRKTYSVYLFDLLCALFLMHFLLPIVGLYMPSIIYGVLTIATFFGCIKRIVNYRSVNSLFLFFPLFILALIGMICKYLFAFNIVGVITYMYSFVQTYTYGLIAITFIIMGDHQRTNRLMSVVLICYAITSVTTIIGNCRFPMASRWLASLSSTDASYVLYTSHNIGGFTFVYGAVLLLPAIRTLIINKKLSRLCGITLIILLGIMILVSEYTTALLTYIITIVVLLIPKFNVKKAIGLLLILAALLFLVRPLCTGVLNLLIQKDTSSVRIARYQYVIDILEGNDSTDTVKSGDRLLLYGESLNVFLNSHGLGIWNTEGDTGGHSYIFDNMAIYGILGMVIMIFAWTNYYKKIMKCISKKPQGAYLLWGFMLVLFFAIINPKDNVFYLTFIYPLTSAIGLDANFVGEKMICGEEK